VQAHIGGLGRSGGPFLKIETGSCEQSIAGRSITGSPRFACKKGMKFDE
jgi:hypothetical protein